MNPQDRQALKDRIVAEKVGGWRVQRQPVAFWKGVDAYLDGVPRTDNPYRDTRTSTGRQTFSRGYHNAWFRGWDTAMEMLQYEVIYVDDDDDDPDD